MPRPRVKTTRSKTKPPKGDNDPSNFDKFERQVTAEVNKRESPTFVAGKTLSPNLESRSYFDVYQLDFGRLDDEPPLIIAGNDGQIALQASLLRALDQLLTVRGLGTFNFEVWRKEFENGFPSFDSPELKKLPTNEVWPGITKENRPKIVECESKVAEGWDFKVVKFLPDRTVKDDWKVFTGSYRQIAQEILNWWNQKEGGGGNSVRPRLTSDISQLSKHPYISLYFRELPASSGSRGGTPLESEVSFRLMNEIEYEGLMPGKSVISIGDIKRYASAVEKIFNNNKDKPYTIQRGRGSYTYNNWPLGYKLWLLANSAAEAERVFKDVLKIQNHTFDEIYMGIGASRNPAKKYPITQPKKKVLNENKALPNQRQTGSVIFRWAKLVLPMCKESLVLCSREPRMRVDERIK